MKRIVATGIVLLSLCSIAEAHRLSGTVTYYGGSDRLCGRRTASGAVLNCAAMTAAHRTLPTDGSEWWPVDPGHGDRSRSVHRRVPPSLAGGRERARLPLHPSQRDCHGSPNGIWRYRDRQSKPSTSRRYGSDVAVLSADGDLRARVGNVRIRNGHGSGSAPSPSSWWSQPELNFFTPTKRRCYSIT